MANIEHILNRLDKVSRSGKEWMARCPVHDDTNNSLSIGTGTDGRVLLHCHAGCAMADIVRAMGLSESDLFQDQPSAAAKVIAATYDYIDEDGRLLYQAVRYEPKGFCQRRPLEGGSWTYSLGDVRRVLYRLPEVLQATRDGRFVFVVEGEKDADALAGLDLVATTAPMGAGKWKADYTISLSAAHVVLVPDQDAPGRKHAEQVAASLHGTASVIRIVHLPEEWRGYDISDWIAAGHSKDELLELVRLAPVYAPQSYQETPEPRPPGVFLRVSDVESKRVSWLWPGRLALGKITVLDGDPGTGKSILYCDNAARVSTGRDWPDGSPSIQGGVVIVTVEDDIADTIRPRLEAAGADLDRVVVLQTVPTASGPRPILLPGDLEIIVSTCRAVEARLLVIDPLMAHLGMDHDSYRDQDVRVAIGGLMKALPSLGTSCLILRHLTKQHSGKAIYRGSGSIGIVGAARIGLLLAPHPEDEDQRVLAATKNNLGPRAASLAFRLQSSVWRPDVPVVQFEGAVTITADALISGGMPAPRSKVDQARDWITDQLADGPLPEAVVRARAEEDGISSRTLDRAKSALAVSVRWGGSDGFWHWNLVGHEPTVDELRRLERMARPQRAPNVEKEGDVEYLTPSEHTGMAALEIPSQNGRSHENNLAPFAEDGSLRPPTPGTGGLTGSLFD
jgi:hypothetical protein